MNGLSASSSQAGPSSSSSVAIGHHPQNQFPQTELPDGQHSAAICDHLWTHGWLRGQYSDVDVLVQNRTYKLHRILLSKSPYMVYQMSMAPPGHPIWLPASQDPMYEEAVAIVLSYLYASHAYSRVDARNARSVLYVADMFQIPEMVSYAYDVCRQSIGLDNISDWVEWVEAQTPPRNDQPSVSSSRASTPLSMPADGQHTNGTGHGFAAVGSEGMSFGTAPVTQVSGSAPQRQEASRQTTSSGWQDVLSQPVTNYVTQLKQDIYNYLTVRLPEELQNSDPDTPLVQNQKFKEIIVQLPFDLFKTCIEDSRLNLGSDQERFAFAKSTIQQRKKKNAARNTQGQPETPSIVENVVLRFGGGSGSKVHITRKSKQRSLWKVEKD